MLLRPCKSKVFAIHLQQPLQESAQQPKQWNHFIRFIHHLQNRSRLYLNWIINYDRPYLNWHTNYNSYFNGFANHKLWYLNWILKCYVNCQSGCWRSTYLSCCEWNAFATSSTTSSAKHCSTVFKTAKRRQAINNALIKKPISEIRPAVHLGMFDLN